MSDKPHQARKPYRRHGLFTAKRQLEDGKVPAPVRAEMAAWVQAVADDLGGDENLSEQQRTVIELAARTRYLLGVADAFLADKGEWAIIHKRDRRLHSIVHDRMRLSNALASYLSQLGLEKRKRPPQDLTDYIAERYAADGDKGR